MRTVTLLDIALSAGALQGRQIFIYCGVTIRGRRVRQGESLAGPHWRTHLSFLRRGSGNAYPSCIGGGDFSKLGLTGLPHVQGSAGERLTAW